MSQNKNCTRRQSERRAKGPLGQIDQRLVELERKARPATNGHDAREIVEASRRGEPAWPLVAAIKDPGVREQVRAIVQLIDDKQREARTQPQGTLPPAAPTPRAEHPQPTRRAPIATGQSLIAKAASEPRPKPQTPLVAAVVLTPREPSAPPPAPLSRAVNWDVAIRQGRLARRAELALTRP